MRSAICLVLFGLNFTSGEANATALVNYRHLGAKGESSKNAGDLALARVQRVKELLGTADLPPLLTAASNPLAGLGASRLSNRYKRSASHVIKQLMRDAVEQLANLEKYGKPTTFHPASLNNEGESRTSRRKKVCSEFLHQEIPRLKTTNFGQLTKEYGAILSKREVALKQPVFPKLDGVRSQLNQYIVRNQPKGDVQLTNVLGQLTDVGYADGVVSHLYFSKGATVSLSSLITYRTGEDELFLSLLGCFRNEITDASEGNKHADLKPLIAYLKPLLDQRVKRAVRLHDQYTKLGKAQVNFLIHVLLDVRGYDVPAEAEFMVGDGKVFPQYSLVEHFSTYRPSSPAKGIPDQTMDDYQFYKNLNIILRDLEDHLTEEKALEAQTEGIINNLRAMGQ